MKLTRIDNKFYDENGQEVKWHFISKVTGLDRGGSRIVMKKLAETGADVPPEKLLRWRDDMVLMWKLEKVFGVTA